MYVRFCWNKDGISDGQMMERECMDIKEIQQKGGNCLEMFGNASFSLLEISIVWDPHLFAWNIGNQFVWAESRWMTRIFRFSASLLK